MLEKKTPFEVWVGYKPSVLNLKVFGCICYTHIPEAKRDKLDKKAEAGIFIGYSSITKGYRIYQPVAKKITVSRDVRFDESAVWN